MQQRYPLLPAYYRLAEDLRSKIENGELKPGDMIPPATQLAEQYGISLMTVRQGLALLAQRGYIKTVQGKGSFVATPPTDTLVLRFSDSHLLGEGRNVKVRLLGFQIVPADPAVAGRLGVKEGSKVIKIKRLLSDGEELVAIDYRFLIYIKGMPLLEKEIAYAAFPDLVARHSEVFLVKSTLEISAFALTAEEAEVLEVSQGFPGLCLEQVIYLLDGRPVGWSRMVCRGDRLTLKAASHDL